MHFTLPVIQNNLCKVVRASFRCDGPQHIGQVLKPKLVCGLHAAQFRIDLESSCLAFHLCLACCLRHKLCTAEIDSGRSATMPVIHCLGSTSDYIGFKDGC